jgi:hypothetical protein
VGGERGQGESIGFEFARVGERNGWVGGWVGGFMADSWRIHGGFMADS